MGKSIFDVIFPIFIPISLKTGKNNPDISNLEFERHGFLENQVYLPTAEQAETNIC